MTALDRKRKEQWAEIKAKVIAGIEVEEVAKEYGKTKAAIYMKAFKQKWPTPHRIRQAMAPGDRALSDTQLEKKQNEMLIRHSAEVLREKGEQGTSKAVDALLSLIKKIKPNELEKIADVQSLATAVNTLRKATGLDKSEQNAAVNVNVALFGQSGEPSFRVIED